MAEDIKKALLALIDLLEIDAKTVAFLYGLEMSDKYKGLIQDLKEAVMKI